MPIRTPTWYPLLVSRAMPLCAQPAPPVGRRWRSRPVRDLGAGPVALACGDSATMVDRRPRRLGSGRCRAARHPDRLSCASPALGGGADVCLAGSVSPPEPGLRGLPRLLGGVDLSGDDPADGRPPGPIGAFQTPSETCDVLLLFMRGACPKIVIAFEPGGTARSAMCRHNFAPL